ncbi:hypothetical protein GYMLUDRAFT_183426, partial [Collybiopsis luxurians FD-317 M1]
PPCGYLGHSLQWHYDTVYGTAFAPNGSKIISIPGDGTLKIWDATVTADVHSVAFEGCVMHYNT